MGRLLHSLNQMRNHLSQTGITKSGVAGIWRCLQLLVLPFPSSGWWLRKLIRYTRPLSILNHPPRIGGRRSSWDLPVPFTHEPIPVVGEVGSLPHKSVHLEDLRLVEGSSIPLVDFGCEVQVQVQVEGKSK